MCCRLSYAINTGFIFVFFSSFESEILPVAWSNFKCDSVEEYNFSVCKLNPVISRKVENVVFLSQGNAGFIPTFPRIIVGNSYHIAMNKVRNNEYLFHTMFFKVCASVYLSSQVRKSSTLERLTVISKLLDGEGIILSRPPACFMMLVIAFKDMMQLRDIMKNLSGSSSSFTMFSAMSMIYFWPSSVISQLLFSSE